MCRVPTTCVFTVSVWRCECAQQGWLLQNNLPSIAIILYSSSSSSTNLRMALGSLVRVLASPQFGCCLLLFFFCMFILSFFRRSTACTHSQCTIRHTYIYERAGNVCCHIKLVRNVKLLPCLSNTPLRCMSSSPLLCGGLHDECEYCKMYVVRDTTPLPTW